MNESPKRYLLVIASLGSLAANTLGTILAVQQDLPADFGGFLNGQNVLRDFLGFNGTALSAPFPFLLIQTVLTVLVLRPGKLGRIGIKGLTFMGALYTVAQAGEPIAWRLMQPGGFDLLQATIILCAGFFHDDVHRWSVAVAGRTNAPSGFNLINISLRSRGPDFTGFK